MGEYTYNFILFGPFFVQTLRKSNFTHKKANSTMYRNVCDARCGAKTMRLVDDIENFVQMPNLIFSQKRKTQKPEKKPTECCEHLDKNIDMNCVQLFCLVAGMEHFHIEDEKIIAHAYKVSKKLYVITRVTY